MKRLITILLVLLYSVSTIGATVTTHFCAGKVRKCKCGKPSKKDVCCSEKTVFLKAQDTHQFKNLATTPNKKTSLNSVNEFLTVEYKFIFSNSKRFFVSNKALIDVGPPIYELICSYLI